MARLSYKMDYFDSSINEDLLSDEELNDRVQAEEHQKAEDALDLIDGLIDAFRTVRKLGK